jgi:hypothetical protein
MAFSTKSQMQVAANGGANTSSNTKGRSGGANGTDVGSSSAINAVGDMMLSDGAVKDTDKHKDIQQHALTQDDDANEDSDTSTQQNTLGDNTHSRPVPLAADTIAVQSSQEAPDVDI